MTKHYELKLLTEDDETAVYGGYGVVFGDKDLEGDTFTKDTDFMLDLVPVKPAYVDHAQDTHVEMDGVKFALKGIDSKVGDVVEVAPDDIGLYMKLQFEKSNQYWGVVDAMLSSTKCGLSSGSVPHLVRRDGGEIKTWPIFEESLTLTPAEPRTAKLGLEKIKHLADDNPELKALLPEDAGNVSAGATAADNQTLDININVNVNSGGEPTDDPAREPIEMTDEIKVDEKQPENEAETKAAVDMGAMKSMFESVVNPIVERIEALEKQPVAEPVTAVPNIKRVTKAGFSNDEVDTFKHWLRTGDEVAAKAALQEGTDAEGGYLVPEGMLPQVVEKRDETSILRQAGVQTFTTQRDVFNIPVENAKMSTFAITAEEGAYTENEPTFNEVAVTIYKFTKLVKVSEELFADNNTGLDAYLNRAFGRAWGLTENQYGLIGTGSSQPQGVFVGGTAGVTAASATAIAAGEVPELYYKLGQQYRDNAVWVSSGSTEGALRALQGQDFLFANSPQGAISGAFWGMKPLLTSESAADIEASAKSLLVGNFAYYGLVGRENLTIQRNPYLYQANGQIGIFAKVRMGGAVLQAEAFQYLTQAGS
jgi:HK97 family phage major capsid protein